MKYRLLAVALMGFMSLPGYAENNRADYDLDDDGLIEINDLQDLNEIRNNTSPALYGQTAGCYSFSCTGFELTRDLDFDTNQNGVFDEGDVYWNAGEGWEPLPLNSATFDGNGFVIRHLTINRAAGQQGLFGTAVYSFIRRLGLVDASITVGGSSGVLAGTSFETDVDGVFATGKVAGLGQSYYLGGLIGYATVTQITNTFSAVDVNAFMFAGSVVGMVGTDLVLRSVWAAGKINITIGSAAGFGGVGGNPQFFNSYMATDVSGLPYDNVTEQIGSFGALLSELKCPVGANDTSCISGKTLYKDWSSQDIGGLGVYWDFGTNQELPGLVLNGRLHRIDVTLNTSSSASSSSSMSSSSSRTSSSSSAKSNTSPASVPSSLQSSSSSSRSVSSCMTRSPASVPGSVSSRSSSSTSSCWNWTVPNSSVSSSSSSSSKKKKSSSSSSSSKKKKPHH